MFEVEVTIKTPVGDFDAGTVDLLDEEIKDTDELMGFLQTEVEEWVAGKEDHDGVLEDFDYDDDCSASISTPSECSLQEAFDYVEWYCDGRRNNAVDIVAAAVALDIKAGDIDDCYVGEYSSIRDFVEEQIEAFVDDMPSWIAIDYEATWHSALRFDYVEEDGHYFRNQ